MKLFVIILPTVILSCECANRCNNDSTPISVVPGKPTILPIATLSSTDISISFDNAITSFEFHKSIKGNVSLSIYSDLDHTIGVTIASNKSQCNITIKTLPLCPPGFSFDEKRKTCTCLNLMKLYPIFKCNHENFTAKVLVDYCVNLDNNNTLATRCPFAGLQSDVYTLLEQVNNRSFCAGLNRHLSYCHNCIDDHGVSVYSDTFKCIYCKSSRWSDILWYVAFETIPASIFFLFVLYFHIGVTSGPANGFIFFSQIVTMPFEVTFLRFVTTLAITSLSNFRYLTRVFVDSVIDPYSIWSLDFYRIVLNDQICLSRGLRAIDVFTLRYLSTLFPLLLLLCAYVIIELQAMNVRPVLWFLSIVCFPCMRWRRVWKAKISILDAFASYFLLSYTKLMYISILLLSRTRVLGSSDSYYVPSVDPSFKYFSKDHVPFFILSVLFILTFGAFPPLLLTFYQHKSCASCLERVHVKRPGLEQFVLAFQQCYKDGTNGSVDRRFFAGLYFVFRVIIIAGYTLQVSSFIVLYKAVACIIFLFICAISQPYKKAVYTFIDCLFFAILALLSILQFYMYTLLHQEGNVTRNFLAYYFFLYIPLLYMIIYVVCWLLRYFKNRGSNRYLLINNNDDNDKENEEREEHRGPVHIDISPRPSITHTEVSITELSQEDGLDSDNANSETDPLLKKQEMKIFSQHAATLSQEYFAEY